MRPPEHGQPPEQPDRRELPDRRPPEGRRPPERRPAPDRRSPEGRRSSERDGQGPIRSQGTLPGPPERGRPRDSRQFPERRSSERGGPPERGLAPDGRAPTGRRLSQRDGQSPIRGQAPQPGPPERGQAPDRRPPTGSWPSQRDGQLPIRSQGPLPGPPEPGQAPDRRPPRGRRPPERGGPPKRGKPPALRSPERGQSAERRSIRQPSPERQPSRERGQLPGRGQSAERRSFRRGSPEPDRLPDRRRPPEARLPERSRPSERRSSERRPTERHRTPQPRPPGRGRLPERSQLLEPVLPDRRRLLEPVTPDRRRLSRPRPSGPRRQSGPRRPPGRGRLRRRSRLPGLGRFAGHGIALQGPLADSLNAARQAFRIWRRTRPFWGGLLIIGGACEILMSERGPVALVIHIGIQGLAGYLIPVMLLLCGVLLWFNPAQRAFYSLLAIVLALGSWITSNLGGFFLGMLLGLVGGALAFAWATDSDGQRLRWFRGNPQILHPSWGLELVVRPAAALPPARRAVGSIESGRNASSPGARPSPAVIVFGSNDFWDDESAPANSDSAGTLGPAAGGVERARCSVISGEILPLIAAAPHNVHGRTIYQEDGDTNAPGATCPPCGAARPPPGTAPSPVGQDSQSFRVSPASESAFRGLHQLACRLGDAAGQRRVDGERVGEVIDT